MVSALSGAEETIQDRTYQSGEHITVSDAESISTSGSVVVKPEADVLFAATRQVLLRPGFHAQEGSFFRAWVPDLRTPTLIVLNGDEQISAPGTFNAHPFDVAVWHGDEPLVNQPVRFSVEQGSGLLYSAPTADQDGCSQLTLMSDAHGTVQAYFRQPVNAGVMSTILVSAAGKSVKIFSFSSKMPGSDDFATWAAAHGLDPSAPNADTDGDGMNNFEEYIHGFNPHVPDNPILGLEIFTPNN